MKLGSMKPVAQVLVRIVCQELEGWLLGDLSAVSQAYPVAARTLKATHRRYPQPDIMTNASEVLKQLTQVPGKVGRAKAISAHMSVDDNLSHSFQVFVSGVKRLAGDQSAEQP